MSSWKVTIADKSMLLDDLSEDDFMSVCNQHPGVNWLVLYNSPGINPAAFYSLLCLCARLMEVPSPNKPQTIKESTELLDYVEKVDDDLPTAFDDGALPLGDTADDQETPTSSTSTAPADGPLSKLAELL